MIFLYFVEPVVRCLPENVLSAPLTLLGSVDEKGHAKLLNYTLANISRTVISSSGILIFCRWKCVSDLKSLFAKVVCYRRTIWHFLLLLMVHIFWIKAFSFLHFWKLWAKKYLNCRSSCDLLSNTSPSSFPKLRKFTKYYHYYYWRCGVMVITTTAQKVKFSIKDFFHKYDQVPRNLQIWSHLPKMVSLFGKYLLKYS